MSVKEKLLACVLAALFVLAIVAVYAVLVIEGKTDVNPLLVLLSSLVTAVVGWVSGLAGHASATAAAAQAAGGAPSTRVDLQAPLVSVTTPPAPGPEPAAPAATTSLQ
ncbi:MULTISPECIES: hypothetical protein [unclassified Achromobacter]|uniref:hypothetical protein n=1 Tax=unclassified Achromobacter TaxID=2626865 RepID=UPI000B5188B0|nr:MULTISPECIES: hypothetical protein [unclassified Achromobacter]OWT69196.1 hypothetical protein CEY05_28635 [Achromobacter sp. HZ34]OWT70601.1 hypothetical protein CEY04_27465 [Achromobacter sp. HZ28]